MNPVQECRDIHRHYSSLIAQIEITNQDDVKKIINLLDHEIIDLISVKFPVYHRILQKLGMIV